MIIKTEVTCSKCNREVRVIIKLNKTNQVTDSDGFVIFEDEAVCDTCLKDFPNNQ